MRIIVNGIEIETSGPATVLDAAACVGIHRGAGGVAAALDGEVVPSGRWHITPIYEGARIEVVRAAAGG